MRGWVKVGFVLVAGAGLGGPAASGQVVERDTTITGPRGRTIERRIRAERGPGFIEREVDIRRPAGEFHRETIIRPGVAGRPGGPGLWAGGGPRGFGPGREVIVERDVIVAPPPPPPFFGGFLSLGAPLFGLSLGAPPPPVYVAPQPPPVVVYNQPQRSFPAPAPETVVVDPVATELGRLQSYHSHSRRDGALTLGRLGDLRAVPALMGLLKDDHDKEVRIAAAWALSEIGDPRAGVYLERAALFDKKPEVRDAAARAYRRLPREAPATASNAAPPRNMAPDRPLAADPNTPPPPPTPDDR